eukprot:2128788-Lingulodinium_polyedra.AAC.1
MEPELHLALHLLALDPLGNLEAEMLGHQPELDVLFALDVLRPKLVDHLRGLLRGPLPDLRHDHVVYRDVWRSHAAHVDLLARLCLLLQLLDPLLVLLVCRQPGSCQACPLWHEECPVGVGLELRHIPGQDERHLCDERHQLVHAPAAFAPALLARLGRRALARASAHDSASDRRRPRGGSRSATTSSMPGCGDEGKTPAGVGVVLNNRSEL